MFIFRYHYGNRRIESTACRAWTDREGEVYLDGGAGERAEGHPLQCHQDRVKLPQFEDVKQLETVKMHFFMIDLSHILFIMSMYSALNVLDEGRAGAGGPHHLSEPIPEE